MKLLLDTHIWLWGLLDPDRLTPPVRRALSDPANELWLSPISVWEALVLVERGRLVVTEDPITWIDRMVDALPRREAPLTHDIAIASRSLALSHQDPADRFIAATARVMNLTLVTADERLLQSTQYQVPANRQRRVACTASVPDQPHARSTHASRWPTAGRPMAITVMAPKPDVGAGLPPDGHRPVVQADVVTSRDGGPPRPISSTRSGGTKAAHMPSARRLTFTFRHAAA